MPIIKSRRLRKRQRRVLYLQLGLQLLALSCSPSLLAGIDDTASLGGQVANVITFVALLIGAALTTTELRVMQLEEDLAEWLGLPINVDDAEVRLATEIALAKHSARSSSEASSQASEEPFE